jgi:hypothetical protein
MGETIIDLEKYGEVNREMRRSSGEYRQEIYQTLRRTKGGNQ